jgi:DNA-binding transcriptional MerR regulator
MANEFFTSKQAAEITGCSLRQLQYWRDKGVIVPTVSASGTGRSIYYSRSELVELAVMGYWLSVGLSFETALKALQMLRDKELQYSSPDRSRRLMLVWEWKGRSLMLLEFNHETAHAALDKGLPVIPVWLDAIHQRLQNALERST